MTQMKKIMNLFVVSSLLIASLTSCGTDELEGRLGGEFDVPITEYLDREDQYSQLVELLELTNLYNIIGAYNPENSVGKYSLFAPSNEAINLYVSESGYASYDAFKADTAFVREMLLMHMLDGALAQSAFSVGAQSKMTLNDERLTFIYDEAEAKFKINERAFVITEQIELGNGYVHEIDAMLLPFTETAYSILKKSDEYTLFTAALELAYVFEEENGIITPTTKTLAQLIDIVFEIPEERMTIMAITDEEFASNDIYTIEDLQQWAIISYFDGELPATEFSDQELNYLLYKLIGLHIIEGNYYHVDFASTATGYASLNNEIIQISNASFVTMLEGVDVFDTIIEGTDTTEIDYITLDLNNSNVSSQSAVIHQVSDIFCLAQYSDLVNYYRSDPRYDEPYLEDLFNTWATLVEDNQEVEERFPEENVLDNISYTGEKSFSYFRTNSDVSNALNNDYLQFEGFFEMTYTTEKDIAAGAYELYVKGAGDVVVDIYVDGKLAKMRFSINRGLTEFTLLNSAEPIPLIFDTKGKHTITVKTVTPGEFYLDFYRFDLIKSF